MRRSSKFACLTALLLTGCAGATWVAGTNQPESGLTARALAPRLAEEDVRREHLAASLGVLSGKDAMADGKRIPERGTAAGRELTRAFLTRSLEGLGYKLEPHRYRSSGENLLVRLAATVPTDEVILVGAHMDSVRNAGADDNATGSAAVLEAARVLRALPARRANVIFAFFDEEELGLVGSRALARDFKKQGLRLTAVHTLDMVGYDRDKDRAVEVEQPDGIWWDYYQMVNERHGLKLPLVRTSSGDTDHVAFREAGFVSVGLCEEWVGKDTTPAYHKATDTFDTVDLDFLTSTTRLLVAAVGDWLQGVPAPKASRVQPHSDFPGRARPFHSHEAGAAEPATP